MNLLLRARSGSIPLRMNGEGELLLHPKDIQGMLCIELFPLSARRGMMSALLGETRKLHAHFGGPIQFEDPMRDALADRLKVKVVRAPFLQTCYGAYPRRVKRSKVQLSDYDWSDANPLLIYLQDILTKLTASLSLAKVNQAFQEALQQAARNPTRAQIFVRDLHHLDPKGSVLESKIFQYHASLQRFLRGEDSRFVPSSALHLSLIEQIDRASQDREWLYGLRSIDSHKFSIFTAPAHTNHWIRLNEERELYIRGAPYGQISFDLDMEVERLKESEVQRLTRGPMCCRFQHKGVVIARIGAESLEEATEDWPLMSIDRIRNLGQNVRLKERSA